MTPGCASKGMTSKLAGGWGGVTVLLDMDPAFKKDVTSGMGSPMSGLMGDPMTPGFFSYFIFVLLFFNKVSSINYIVIVVIKVTINFLSRLIERTTMVPDSYNTSQTISQEIFINFL